MGTLGQRFEDVEQAARQKSDREGELTKRIEHFTAAAPSSAWLIAGGAAALASIGLTVFGRHKSAALIASWVPSLLVMGLYNKLVKVIGSDKREHAMASY